MAGNGHGPTPDELIVGLMIARPDLLQLAADIETYHYETIKCQVCWDAIRNVEARGEPIDLETVLAQLVAAEHDGAISDGSEDGGRKYLTRLARHGTDVRLGRDPLGQLDALRARKERRDTERSETLIAARDAEPDEPAAQAERVRIDSDRCWLRAPEIVDQIWDRRNEPWLGLKLGASELCRVRAGNTVVVIGGPGSGKSSLTGNVLLQHARDIGPAISLSIELPADEWGARIAGIRGDASWEDVLCGRIERKFLEQHLALPRLYVIERRHATLEALARCVAAARAEYPGEPILAAVDYAQLVQSREREVRSRVADALERIDDAARSLRVGMIAVSQMGRAGAKLAREGDRIGAEASDLGAETSAIERFATATLTIGKVGEPRENGSRAVELSLGKGRMTGGDVVIGASYWGRSGLWRVTDEPKSAAVVREQRETDKEQSEVRSVENQTIGLITAATKPVSRNDIVEQVKGRRALVLTTIRKLLTDGTIVETDQRAPRSRQWTIWTPAAVSATPGIGLAQAIGSDS